MSRLANVPELSVDYVAPGFELVREVFLENFVSRREIGAACVVYHQGRVVVDLIGGHLEPQRQRAYNKDTLQVVFSSTKVIEGLCIARLVDQGKLDYNEPIAKYWPEFAQHSKEHITVKQLMRHQAAMVGLDEPLTFAEMHDLDRVATRFANQRPFWIPRDERASKDANSAKKALPVQQSYHAISRGIMSNELVRRVDGRTLGQYAREEICIPLGVEFYIGLPEELEPRMSMLHAPSAAAQSKFILPQLCLCGCVSRHMIHPSDRLDTLELKSVSRIAHTMATAPKPKKASGKVKKQPSTRAATLQLFPEMFPIHVGANTRAYREIELPSANGVTNARSIAKIGAVMANGGHLDGVTLLSPSTFALAHEVDGPVLDQFAARQVQFASGGWGVGRPAGCAKGRLGIEIPQDNTFTESVVEIDQTLCGWGGAGGSLFTWSREHNASMGYVMNRMGAQLIVDRSSHLANALAVCLENLARK